METMFRAQRIMNTNLNNRKMAKMNTDADVVAIAASMPVVAAAAADPFVVLFMLLFLLLPLLR